MTWAMPSNFNSTQNTYSVIRQISEGRAGYIFHVINENGQELALKTLKKYTSLNELPNNFRTEIQFCSKKIHPNIIQALDWGVVRCSWGALPFYVMPFYLKTLDMILCENPDVYLLGSIARQILDGLDAIHALGVWHRDIKAKNILVDPTTSRVVISDFGSAHIPKSLLGSSIRKDIVKYASEANSYDARRCCIGQEGAETYAVTLVLRELLIIFLANLNSASQRDFRSIPLDFFRRFFEFNSVERPTSIGSLRRMISPIFTSSMNGFGFDGAHL